MDDHSPGRIVIREVVISNALGLTLIFLGIALLVGLVGCLARKYPHTARGCLSKRIAAFIDHLPED